MPSLFLCRLREVSLLNSGKSFNSCLSIRNLLLDYISCIEVCFCTVSRLKLGYLSLLLCYSTTYIGKGVSSSILSLFVIPLSPPLWIFVPESSLVYSSVCLERKRIGWRCHLYLLFLLLNWHGSFYWIYRSICHPILVYDRLVDLSICLRSNLFLFSMSNILPSKHRCSSIRHLHDNSICCWWSNDRHLYLELFCSYVDNRALRMIGDHLLDTEGVLFLHPRLFTCHLFDIHLDSEIVIKTHHCI